MNTPAVLLNNATEKLAVSRPRRHRRELASGLSGCVMAQCWRRRQKGLSGQKSAFDNLRAERLGCLVSGDGEISASVAGRHWRCRKTTARDHLVMVDTKKRTGRHGQAGDISNSAKGEDGPRLQSKSPRAGSACGEFETPIGQQLSEDVETLFGRARLPCLLGWDFGEFPCFLHESTAAR